MRRFIPVSGLFQLAGLGCALSLIVSGAVLAQDTPPAAPAAAPATEAPIDGAPVAAPDSEPTLSDDELLALLRDGGNAVAISGAITTLTEHAQTDPALAYALGRIFYSGTLAVPQDYEQADPLFEIAANDGSAKALAARGDIRRLGKPPFDPADAFEFYRAAADLGDADAAYRVGSAFRTGNGGVEADRALALKYLLIADAGGDERGLVRLGDIYRRGADLGLDQSLAADYYRRAGETGDAAALYQLGNIYRDGLGSMQPDATAAVEAYKKAIAAGNNLAKLGLARGYLAGQFGEGHGAEARGLLDAAITSNVAGAKFELARGYISGRQIPRDVPKAMDLLNQAIADGDVNAGRYLIRLLTEGRIRGVPAGKRAAAAALEQITPLLAADVLNFEAAIVDASAPASAADFAALDTRFAALDQANQRALFARILTVNENAYVLLLQKRLSELGYYQGSQNGQLTASTIAALNKACDEKQIGSQCRAGPLSEATREALSTALF